MPIRFTESAGRHGFTLADAVAVLLNHRDKVESFDEPRAAGRSRPDLYVGRAPSGELLEVMVERRERREIVIFHCMTARPKMLRLIEEMRPS